MALRFSSPPTYELAHPPPTGELNATLFTPELIVGPFPSPIDELDLVSFVLRRPKSSSFRLLSLSPGCPY